MIQSFHEWFWSPNFWLPQGFTWEDVKGNPMSTLYMAPVLAIILLATRYVFERYVASSICIRIGIPDPDNNAPQATEGRGYLPVPKKKLAKQFTKATETCWRCFCYFLLFWYGAFITFRTDWFWDSDLWLVGYLKTQPFTFELKCYYVAELSFYFSLLFTHFQDTKRRDFVQQFFHHLLTIILLCGSYTLNHFRYGSVIMLLHDASDYWLEAAKLAKYAKKQRTCDCLFVIFAMMFYLSRWVYFPLCVIRPFLKDNARLTGPLESYLTFPYICSYMCYCLLALHIYWGYLIGRMVYKFAVVGKVEKDHRSDDEN